MSNTITKTALTGLITLVALAAIAPSVPAVAQEAIMLETHGFVRMVQPDEARQIQARQSQSQRQTQAEESRHASAD